MVGGGSAWYFLTGARTARNDLVTHPVRYEKLQLTIIERGALESAENSDVICRVKAGAKNSTVSTTIKWVIDDGAQVRRGDLLIDLDDSGLQEQLKTQKITLDTNEANKIQAEEAYKITVGQNESDIKAAEIDLELAKIDIRKYLEGDYPQSLKDVEGRISQSESDAEMQRDRMAWAQRMVKKGYYTVSQAQAEQSKLESFELSLRKVLEERRVLTDPDYGLKKRTETDLASKVALKERELIRIKAQALAKEVQARTDRETKKSLYLQSLAQYQDIESEIRLCKMYAPQDGMVVYYVPEQSRFGSGTQQSIVAQGEPVREGQKLMRIPTLNKMLVNTKVHEALVSRVKGEIIQQTGFCDAVRAALVMDQDVLSRWLSIEAFGEMHEKFRDREIRQIYGGQPAMVRIDAFPDRVLHGHVKSVATVASQADWMSTDVKVYQTMVSIDEPVEGQKPGMSSEVTILAGATDEPVLAVPIQAIFGSPSMGRVRKCFVLTSEGTTEEREIEVGMSNDKMAEIKKGLEEGDEVVLNPRSLMSEKDRLKNTAGEKTDFGKGKGKGAGKGDKAGGWQGGPGGPTEGPGGPGGPNGGPNGKAGGWPGAGGDKAGGGFPGKGGGGS